MEIIVGSTALKLLGFDSYPQDMDIWTDVPFESKGGIDRVFMPTEILSTVPTVEIDNKLVATLDALYTIKASHMAWANPKWAKNKQSLLFMMKAGGKLIQSLYDALFEHWKGELGKKDFLSLNQTKDEFFTDNVTYVMDHDKLHELVAHPNRPVYERCLKAGHDVLIDKQKFDAMDFKDRVRMFREEISVIAIERWLINPRTRGKISWNRAYSYALEKTVTTLTKGWASQFLVLNFTEFVIPDYSYFETALNYAKENL